MQKVRLLVSGRVQGVGFRYSTYALALDIGDIYGRVWNNDCLLYTSPSPRDCS